MIINTTIKTPQFKEERIIGYVTQQGNLSTVSWVFEPVTLIDSGNTFVGMHKVHFKDEKEYQKYKVI